MSRLYKCKNMLCCETSKDYLSKKGLESSLSSIWANHCCFRSGVRILRASMFVHPYTCAFWLFCWQSECVYGAFHYLWILGKIIQFVDCMASWNEFILMFYIFLICRDLTNNRIGCLNADVFKGLVNLIRL